MDGVVTFVGRRLSLNSVFLSGRIREINCRNKKPYIFSPNWWGLDGGSWRIYRAENVS